MIEPRRVYLLCPAILLALSACSTGNMAPANSPVRLTILHTNDHHGHFWENADHEYGLAARKTLIDRVRAEVKSEGGVTLVLDAGDVNTGIPESDLQEAEPDFRGMSLVGYDAMAVGNHEFDKSPAVMQHQQREWSNFPWLSANIYQNGAHLFSPYHIFSVGGLRIAVMGLTTNDTAKMGVAERFPGVQFRPPIDEAATLVPALRRQADVVIALTHMGHYPDGKHGVNAPGDVELARAVPGIDMVVGGHSHNAVCMLEPNVRNDAYVPGAPCAPDRQNGAWIVQAAEWGKFVGRADFELRNGKLELVKYRLLPVNLHKIASGAVTSRPYTEEIPEDKQMLALLQTFRDRAGGKLLEKIGRTSGSFDGVRLHVRNYATNLGRLITTAMMKKTGADLALISSGSIRDSLPAGVVTYRDLLMVQPFGNHIVVVSMRGDELQNYLQAVARMTPGSGAFAQYAGMRMQLTSDRRIASITIGGKNIDPQAIYRIAVNSFIAKGGDGYPDLSRHPDNFDTDLSDVAVLRDYIADHDLLNPEDFIP
ncbi:5'-nucleotidase / UDP-sugar diphosphatase [Collimonas sp. OK307]|nr:bifunctional UDP-sugar hydrolase/5'-nucleotidase UshA [Collimonas sp. OK307]SFI37761.1 5'-nucleotidase / UDP-sugar diphosphatase [Collimonas sp. OK307]